MCIEMYIKCTEVMYAKAVFLNWGSVRYTAGFKKLSRFFSVEHEIISFIIFFVILDLLLLLLAKLLFLLYVFAVTSCGFV